MKKIKKYDVGGTVDEAGLEEILKYKDQYTLPRRKPLPSETIKEDKRAKAINEGVKEAITSGAAAGPVGMLGSLAKRLKDNVMGTEEQNIAAEAREIERARRNPEGMEAKFRKATGKPFKSGGKVSSASKRGDGCCVKGKTKGKMV